ncbi:MAG: ATP-binding protein [Methanobrevibacter sp.]|nr:ATP-binding protein [Candidatus Methanovirga aequatorialis]
MDIVVKANKKELDKILDTFDVYLDSRNISKTFKLRLSMILEEIFTNIVNHGYEMEDENNLIKIEYKFEEDPLKLIVKFVDKGTPFNPLSSNDPDITLNSDEREVGGLGIFLIKTYVDNTTYEFKDDRNILTIEKVVDE